jgi:hypothetical protein
VVAENTEVQWSIGYTANLGNFQSLRLDVSIKDKARTGETVKQASERVYRFAEAELSKKVEEAKEAFE